MLAPSSPRREDGALRACLAGLLSLLLCGWGSAFACGWWGDVEQAARRESAAGAPETPGIDSDPDYMVELGNRFRRGDGAPRDLALALRWYRLAAVREHPGGQYNLALMYEHGIGVVRDEGLAREWYERAARQGDVHAQHHLADLYRDGRGGPADPEASLHWRLRAAEQGHLEVAPGLVEEFLERAPPDARSAYLWCRVALHGRVATDAKRCDEIGWRLPAGARKAADSEAVERVGGRRPE